MSTNNRVSLTGIATSKPRLCYLDDGTRGLMICVMTTARDKSPDGRTTYERDEFHQVLVSDRERIGRCLLVKAGEWVSVVGQLRTRNFRYKGIRKQQSGYLIHATEQVVTYQQPKADVA